MGVSPRTYYIVRPSRVRADQCDEQHNTLRPSGMPIGLNLACTLEGSSDTAAVMVFKEQAIKAVAKSSPSVRQYISRWHDAWYELASNEDVGLKPEDVILVRGWVKTSSWAWAAIWASTKQSFEISFDANIASAANAGFRVSDNRSTSPRTFISYGPLTLRNARTGDEANSANEAPHYLSPITAEPPDLHPSFVEAFNNAKDSKTRPYDQCCFLQYWKIKRRRILPTKIEARAGYDEFDRSDEGNGKAIEAGSDIEIEEETERVRVSTSSLT